MRPILLGLATAFGTALAFAQAPAPTKPAPTPPPTTKPAATTPAPTTPAPTTPTPPAVAAKPATTDLYPTKKGSKWIYKAGEVEVTLQAGDTDAAGETKLETLVNGKPVASETVKVTTDGIYRTKINNSAIEPPVKILELESKAGGKLGAKPVGTKWAVKSKVLQSDLSGEFTIAKYEPSVEIGGVKYANAVVVEGPNFNIASTETKVTYIFAPGKGVVKLTYSIGGNSTSLELKSFEEGK